MSKAIIFLTKLVITACIVMLFSSCHDRIIHFGDGTKGSGHVVSKIRPVTEDFKSIDVSNGIEVIVEQSDNKEISVEADDNIEPLIETKVENGVLHIRSTKGYNSAQTPKVTVKMPVINALTTSGGAFIESRNTLLSTNLDAKTSSGSSINISVEADMLTLETSSGSHIEAHGKALKLETASSSGSQINAGELMANEVTSSTSSGSHIEVHPIVSLNAKASSGGSVVYRNVPKTVTKEESSGGSVMQQ